MMNPVQCVQNNHGMTLMSTLLAAGLVGIIATATTALMTSSVRNQNSVRQDTNFNLLKSEISRIINNSALCDTAFKESDGTPARYSGSVNTLSSIVRTVGSATIPIVSEGEDIGNGLVVKNLSFARQKDSSGNDIAALTNSPSTGLTTYFVTLEFEAERTRATGNLINQGTPIRLQIITDTSTNEITSCYDQNTTATGANTYVIHSQTNTAPTCPTGYDPLWTGYSLIAVTGGGAGTSFSLDSPASCRPNFQGLPFMECSNGDCDVQTANDYSYWLHRFSTINSPRATLTIGRGWASRCTVCLGTQPILSFPTSCPTGWTQLRQGTQLLFMNGGSGSQMAADGGPSSCLTKTGRIPFMECDMGGCDIGTNDDFAYWSTTRTSDQPSNASVSDSGGRSCYVCMKD